MKKYFLFGILLVFLFGCITQNIEKNYSDQVVVNTFGPGEAAHVHEPTFDLETTLDVTKNPSDLPGPIKRNTSEIVKIHLESKEVISEIAPHIDYAYWTFNGTVPGPFLRVKVGDTVEINLKNHPTSAHPHSIDLHAVTGPGGGATLTQVKPGEEKSFQFKALNPGLYVYHCATPNVPTHASNGMYGLILVEPEEGMEEVDREFYVMQGELYTNNSIGMIGFSNFDPEKMLTENPEYITFNGRIESLVDNPLNAKVGEKIRVYFGNGGISRISSFHVIGEIFDSVYPEASSTKLENVQTTLVPAGGATIVEFELELPGNYVLVDHALSRIERGAWGLLVVEGEENPEIYSELN